MMSGINGKDTKPELALRKALFAKGLRYRLHARNLPGRPDIVLPKWNTVIFVHGCFWHRHTGCKYATTPATRPEFWKEKFCGNVERDARNIESLKSSGWRIAVVWECEIKGDIQKVSKQLAEWLRSDASESSMHFALSF